MDPSKTEKAGHRPGGVEIKTGSPTGHEELGANEGTKLAPDDHPTETQKTIPDKPASPDQPQNPKHPSATTEFDDRVDQPSSGG